MKESQAPSFFRSGLVDELQMPIRMFRPKALADAYSLAHLQEIAVAALQNKPKPTNKNPMTSYTSATLFQSKHSTVQAPITQQNTQNTHN